MLDRARSTIARWIAPEHVRRFDGASLGRRAFGAGTFGRVNSEVGGAAQTLAARSSHLFANNPLISNAVANIVGETVGSGIRPVPRGTDAVGSANLVAAFDTWSEHADADGRTDFYGLQAAVVTDAVVRGEAFALRQFDDDGLTIRLLDVEQVDRSLTRELGSGAQIVQGIEFDARGRRTAYWISPTRLPDNFASWAPPVRVDAAEVLHVYRPLFPGQVRGVPWTASILLGAGELDKLTDALLMGASVAAMFCGIVTDANDLSGADDPFGGEAQPTLEPGTLLRLKGGQQVSFSSPQQSQAVAELLKTQIRALAAGMGVPAFMVDGDLTGANYSSLRAGLIPFRRRIEQFQYHCLVPQLLAPVWRWFIAAESVLGDGLVDQDAAQRCDWIMPKALQVDPSKDIDADLSEIAAGLGSRRQKVAERGWNVDELDAEIAADRKREADLGLSFGSSSKSLPQGKTEEQKESKNV